MRWEQRPVEIANLLNPPFCAILLHEAIHAYEQKDSRGLSFLLINLILPFVVHTKTRRTISSRPNYSFIDWVGRQKIPSQVLASHIHQLTPFTMEGLVWGLDEDVIRFGDRKDSYSNLMTTEKTLQIDASWTRSSTPTDCRNKARIIGNWFAEVADVTTIYRTLGIRP